MRKIDDTGNQSQTELQKSEKSANDRTILFHYTTFDALRHILSDRNLRFNRIDKVNDLMERNIFGEDDLYQLVFVSCFSTEKIESIPMWSIYGKDKHGLRISFELDKAGFVQNLLDKQGKTITSSDYPLTRHGKMNSPCPEWLYTVNMKDIIYDIDAIKRNPIRYREGNNQMFNLTSMAAIKRKEWEYEHECRMIATLQTVRDNVEAPDIDYILVPIKFDHIKKLEITFNPWMEQHTKEEIKQCAYRLHAAGHKIDARVRSIGQLMCYNDLRKIRRSLAWHEQRASRLKNFAPSSARKRPAGQNYSGYGFQTTSSARNAAVRNITRFARGTHSSAVPVDTRLLLPREPLCTARIFR